MTEEREERTALVRTLGRWSLVALVLNAIVGSGVFALPGAVGARLGAASLWAWLVAAAGMLAIMACFAEVASRFRESGGQYRYAQAAFGRHAGLQMGWMGMLVRVTAAATNVNVFAVYLAEFWAPATTPTGKALVALVLLGGLALVNVRGVSGGARTSNAFAVAKLVPLLLFIGLGGWFALSGRSVQLAAGTEATPAGWLQAMLLLVFAYGGFESALLPMAEARDPRRDAPFALLFGLGVVTLVYTLVQLAVLVALPDPGASSRPLAAAAEVFLGSGGAGLMAVAALVSVYGYLASGMVNVPRLTYAMAEQGDLPPVFARVHDRFRTPYVSILVYAALTWALAAQGSLIQNLSLSAVSRLLTYGGVCAALIALRRKEGAADGARKDLVDTDGKALFRLPFGVPLAVLGIALSLILATAMTAREAALLAATIAIAFVHWLLVRRRPRP